MKTLRYVPALLLAIVLLLLTGTAAAQGEVIRNYEIEIDVRTDGSLIVTEHITVFAAGNQIRRGIYRDFPTRYRDQYGNNVVVELEVLGVERNGQPEDWFTETRLNGIRINTGGDDLLPQLPAEYRFTLRYRTTRQLGFFEQHDELYWNAIGTGWDFAIQAASVEVRLPQPVSPAQMEIEAYTGPQGAQGRSYTASVDEPGVARWQLTGTLAPREGFTIVLGFPKGIVDEPTTGQRIGWFFKDNRGVLVALAGLILLLAYCVRRWIQVGRDPLPGIVIARYEPPAGRAPAELRYLRRRAYDTRCFTSDLLTLAVGGDVLIERNERRLRSDTWRLERRNDGSGEAARLPSAVTLFSKLFAGGARSLELVKKNASKLQGAQQAHSKVLNERLHGSHFRRNTGSALIAFAIALVSGVLAFVISGGGGLIAIGVLSALMALTVIVFAVLVQAPTPEGRRLLDEIEGLKLYLSVAERDELKNLQGPPQTSAQDAPPPLDAQRYERLLPYAVALDVEEAWTKKFTAAVGVAAAAAATASIVWYRGGGITDLGSLAQAVGSGLNSSIASASTPPGSSSGGGGGGSSGGGGGGGGGGGR